MYIESGSGPGPSDCGCYKTKVFFYYLVNKTRIPRIFLETEVHSLHKQGVHLEVLSLAGVITLQRNIGIVAYSLHDQKGERDTGLLFPTYSSPRWLFDCMDMYRIDAKTKKIAILL